MARYEVTAWAGTLRVEVNADSEDEAIAAAEQPLAVRLWRDATYEVREAPEPDVGDWGAA